jgi:pimeloyl-ACP methyl ester carboxylesterase
MSAGKKLSGTPEPMHFWRGAGGIRIAGDAWGNPDSPLVVLQHGGGQTRHAWGETGERLGAAGYYAIAFDARGHGDSDWASDGSYGQGVMVQDLQCLIAAVGNPRPVLVGASMGGGTSLVAVGEDHVDASALVLVDIAPHLEPEGVRKIQVFMGQKPEGFDSLEEIAEAIANYQPQRVRPKNLDGLVKNVRLGADGKYRWHWDPRYINWRRDLGRREQRLKACARRLSLPTLLVRGGFSDVLSEAGARDFLALCPHSEFVNVTDAGHMVAGDRNDIFAAAVIAFLARTVPVGGGLEHSPQTQGARRIEPGEDINDVP